MIIVIITTIIIYFIRVFLVRFFLLVSVVEEGEGGVGANQLSIVRRDVNSPSPSCNELRAGAERPFSSRLAKDLPIMFR